MLLRELGSTMFSAGENTESASLRSRLGLLMHAACTARPSLGAPCISRILTSASILLVLLIPASSRGEEVDVTHLDTNQYQKYSEVTSLLRCPTCSGLSVQGSDAPFSLQIKKIVREKVEAGATQAEIFSYFTDRYGPWILREPPKSGFNLLAWIVPIVLMILGPLGVWLLVWKRNQVPDASGVRSNEAIMGEFTTALDKLRGNS